MSDGEKHFEANLIPSKCYEAGITSGCGSDKKRDRFGHNITDQVRVQPASANQLTEPLAPLKTLLRGEEHATQSVSANAEQRIPRLENEKQLRNASIVKRIPRFENAKTLQHDNVTKRIRHVMWAANMNAPATAFAIFLIGCVYPDSRSSAVVPTLEDLKK
ncbi:hypothetical protein HPB50_006469 [Hyalomma asiaticum]|uniref:Uncharacterized protein n=1 Tax=Hyalomma asiaticum TaxID=266040 RepID=A0ACB7T444_HYAAI|nr:hypothetical protein HPB50_006469 [Hyalomma asiaticum]